MQLVQLLLESAKCGERRRSALKLANDVERNVSLIANKRDPKCVLKIQSFKSRSLVFVVYFAEEQ